MFNHLTDFHKYNCGTSDLKGPPFSGSRDLLSCSYASSTSFSRRYPSFRGRAEFGFDLIMIYELMENLISKDNIEKIYLDITDMEFNQPSVMITDYLLSLSLVYFGYLMLKRQEERDYKKFFVMAFFALALASFVGGTYHGLVDSLPDLLATILWKLTLLTVGITNFSLAMGYTGYSLGKFKILRLIIIIKLIVYSTISLLTDNFDIVLYDTGPVFIYIIFLQYRNYTSKRIKSLKWELIALALGLLAMIVYLTKFGLHEYFTSDDIGHIILIGMVYALYKSIIPIITE